MLKIQFVNAQVHDEGWGLEVNGKSLEDIISMALGTKVEGVEYNDPRREKLSKFRSTSCDVTVIINPHPQEVIIEDDNNLFGSVAELEAAVNERVGEKVPEKESES